MVNNGEYVTGFVFAGSLRMEILPLGMQNLVQITRACKLELEAILLLFLKTCLQYCGPLQKLACKKEKKVIRNQ
jgi:hypothetical protein